MEHKYIYRKSRVCDIHTIEYQLPRGVNTKATSNYLKDLKSLTSLRRNLFTPLFFFNK